MRDGIVFVDCYMQGTFAKLHFMVDGRWIEIDPYDYIWDVYADGNTCVMLITKHEYDFFILGMPIYQGFYTYHNVETSTMTFAPLYGMNKTPLKAGTVPSVLLIPEHETQGDCGVLCYFGNAFKLPFEFFYIFIKKSLYLIF